MNNHEKKESFDSFFMTYNLLIGVAEKLIFSKKMYIQQQK